MLAQERYCIVVTRQIEAMLTCILDCLKETETHGTRMGLAQFRLQVHKEAGDPALSFGPHVIVINKSSG